MWTVVLATAASLLVIGPSLAAEAPVVLVEEVNSKTARVEFMDYVETGRVIKLGNQDTLVLGYLKSCAREVITGGVVVVGTERSDVALGDVKRTKVPCDAGQMQLTANQTKQSAGMVVRGVDGSVQGEVRPQITLYGLSPVFEVAGRGSLVVDRVDRVGEQFKLTVSDSQQLMRGRYYDSAKVGNMVLTPGGIYLASFGPRSITFQVDPDAKPGFTPVIGRLLRLQLGEQSQ